MFGKIAAALSLSALVFSGAMASPITYGKGMVRRGSSTFSLDSWGGHASLRGFDNFYGNNNWDGSRNSQTVIVREDEVICRTQRVEIIQQRLAVIQEMAKRIITEQVCEVESQTIIFEQFHNSLGNFRRDINRSSGNRAGFDRDVSSKFSQLIDGGSNQLTSHDLGFNGQQIGSHQVIVGGSNWDNNLSPDSISRALSAAQSANSATSRFI
jgi:hypothetical protein